MKDTKVAVLLIAFISSAAVLMAASRVYLVYRYQPPPRILVNQRVDDPVLSQAQGVKPWVDDSGIDTSAWKILGSEVLGFSVRYPPSWRVTDCLTTTSAPRSFKSLSFSEQSPTGTCSGDQGPPFDEFIIERSWSPRPKEYPRGWINSQQPLLSYQETFFAVNDLTVLWLEYAIEDRGPEGEERAGRPIVYWTNVYFQTPQDGHYKVSLLQYGTREQLVVPSEDFLQRQKLLRAFVGSLRVQ